MTGDFNLRFYLSILIRRLPLVILATALVTGIGLVIAMKLPPVYRANATILVEAPQISTELARSTLPLGPWEQMQIIQQRLMTRENLLDLASRLGIYSNSKTMPDNDDIVADMRGRTKFQLLEMDAPRGARGATMMMVSFDDDNAERAANVVNSFVTLMVDRNSLLRAGLAGDAQRFFQQEVVRLSGELARVESEILKFKTDNQTALPDSLEFRRTQASNQQERLLMLEREETTLRNRRESLARLYEATGQVTSAANASPEQQMLDDLNRSLASQRLLFAEDSPTITALKARITAVRDSIRRAPGEPSTGARQPTPFEIQVSEIDERLAAIGHEKSAIQQSLATLEKSIAATPANETVLASLQRDREQLSAQYQVATARLAEASTGEQIETSDRGGRLSLVEPASPPADPVSPKRLRIAGAALALGLGVGLGLVVLLELLNKTVRRPSELAALFDSELLGVIPYIRTIEEVRASRRRMAAASLAALLMIPLLAYSLPTRVPVNALIGKVVGSADRGSTM